MKYDFQKKRRKDCAFYTSQKRRRKAWVRLAFETITVCLSVLVLPIVVCITFMNCKNGNGSIVISDPVISVLVTIDTAITTVVAILAVCPGMIIMFHEFMGNDYYEEGRTINVELLIGELLCIASADLCLIAYLNAYYIHFPFVVPILLFSAILVFVIKKVTQNRKYFIKVEAIAKAAAPVLLGPPVKRVTDFGTSVIDSNGIYRLYHYCNNQSVLLYETEEKRILCFVIDGFAIDGDESGKITNNNSITIKPNEDIVNAVMRLFYETDKGCYDRKYLMRSVTAPEAKQILEEYTDGNAKGK